MQAQWGILEFTASVLAVAVMLEGCILSCPEDCSLCTRCASPTQRTMAIFCPHVCGGGVWHALTSCMSRGGVLHVLRVYAYRSSACTSTTSCWTYMAGSGAPAGRLTRCDMWPMMWQRESRCDAGGRDCNIGRRDTCGPLRGMGAWAAQIEQGKVEPTMHGTDRRVTALQPRTTLQHRRRDRLMATNHYMTTGCNEYRPISVRAA